MLPRRERSAPPWIGRPQPTRRPGVWSCRSPSELELGGSGVEPAIAYNGASALGRDRSVKRRALTWCPSLFSDQVLQIGRTDLLSVHGARSPRDRLVHEHTADVVGAGVQA